jgi:hypothetical protein
VTDDAPTDAVCRKRCCSVLSTRQSELTALLGKCSSHWGFEDPIYRFYHQSFKVYSLQDETVRIVHVLESLASERSLNPSFRQIVEEGTGHRSGLRITRTGRASRVPF